MRRPVAAEIASRDPAAAAYRVTVRLVEPGAISFATGAVPDLSPNERRGTGPWWLWLAPDRALLIGAATPPDGFVSDVTDGFATFEITGPGAADIVAMACTLDPAGPLLAPGRCAQTVFAGVRVVLYADGSRENFRLHVERPLAAWLLEWFTQAVSALR